MKHYNILVLFAVGLLSTQLNSLHKKSIYASYNSVSFTHIQDTIPKDKPDDLKTVFFYVYNNLGSKNYMFSKSYSNPEEYELEVKSRNCKYGVLDVLKNDKIPKQQVKKYEEYKKNAEKEAYLFYKEKNFKAIYELDANLNKKYFELYRGNNAKWETKNCPELYFKQVRVVHILEEKNLNQDDIVRENTYLEVGDKIIKFELKEAIVYDSKDEFLVEVCVVVRNDEFYRVIGREQVIKGCDGISTTKVDIDATMSIVNGYSQYILYFVVGGVVLLLALVGIGVYYNRKRKNKLQEKRSERRAAGK